MKINGKKFMEARIKSGLGRTEIGRVGKVSFARIFQIETSDYSNVNDFSVEAMACKMGIEAYMLK